MQLSDSMIFHPYQSSSLIYIYTKASSITLSLRKAITQKLYDIVYANNKLVI